MKDIPLWLKYASAIAGIFALVWGCYVYFAPQLSTTFGLPNGASSLSASVRASAIPVEDILRGYSSKSTSLEKQQFVETYENSRVYGLGSFADIAKSGDSYLVAIRTSSGAVNCQFPGEPDTEKRLLLMRKGQAIGFTGVFTNSTLAGSGGWYIEGCTLETL